MPDEMVKSSPARVLEEIFRMLESGYRPLFQLMVESRLLELLFPELTKHFHKIGAKIYSFLIAADEINQTNLKKPLDHGLLVASLVSPSLSASSKASGSKKAFNPIWGSSSSAVYDVLKESPRHKLSPLSTPHLRYRYASDHQPIPPPLPSIGKKKSSGRTLRSRDFPEALLLLKIRASADPAHLPAFENGKPIRSSRTSWKPRSEEAPSRALGLNSRLNMKYSLVSPLKNEEDNVKNLLNEIEPVMKGLGEPFEVLAIDDGSTNQTLLVLKTLKLDRTWLRILKFKENFGQSSAFDAGFKLAGGEFVITLDGDRQNDTADIPKLI